MESDLILVGGGLQSALIFLALHSRDPKTSVTIVESAAFLGGNHTWCFHESDVAPLDLQWVASLVAASWPSWSVAFGDFERTFDSPYSMVTTESLQRAVAHAMRGSSASTVLCNARAHAVTAHYVDLEDGTRLFGKRVIDARGPELDGSEHGYQKFVGLELQLRTPTATRTAVVIDAKVDQEDGFRFFYTLPIDETRLLVEETFFSDSPILDEVKSRRAILEYAKKAGFDVDGILRVETAVLPIPLTCGETKEACEPLRAGYRGGWFHPSTGYSFPVAARLASHIAAFHDGDLFGEQWSRLVENHARQTRFAVLLNRLMFKATQPGNRREVMERFHTLPLPTIQRFYALATTSNDRRRILCGVPPQGVSLRQAIIEVFGP